MARAQGWDEGRFEKEIQQQFICVICLNVLRNPVLCHKNEHSFCRACIVHHLNYKEECPVCKDVLTIQTLRTSKLLNSLLGDLKMKCEYHERGCKESISLEFIDKHVENCGFAPVSCSNDNCVEEINKRDLKYHETEQCLFRKMPECNHCTQLGQKIDLITTKLHHVQYLMTVNLKTKKEFCEAFKKMEDRVQKTEENYTNTNKLVSDLRKEVKTLSTTNEGLVKELKEKHGTTKQKIIITGGTLMEGMEEMFDFTTMAWTPIQPMINDRVGASCFVYNQQILVTGGVCGQNDQTTKEVEAIKIDGIPNAKWSNCQLKLPTELEAHTTTVYDGSFFVIGGRDNTDTISSNIWQVKLQAPYSFEKLTEMPQGRYGHGSVLIHNKVYIFGGMAAESVHLDNVLAYDIVTKQCYEMAPLPCKLSDMAVVRYADNVIIIGGYKHKTGATRTILMYNITSGKSYALPEMIYRRYGSAAVVIGREIIVMGGMDDKEVDLKTVEVFSFDSLSWRELPSMIVARSWPSAVAI